MSARSYSCPSCGADIPFRSSFSVYAVCASCGSTVVRGDRDVSLIGEMADLPDDVSPLQVGTGFTHAGRACTLLGRTRMGWADGAWTEWFFDGGSAQGWLTEAQGFLSVSFERPVPPELASGRLPALGALVPIGGESYRVSDLKRATCIGSEGELPFTAPRGRSATYADMVGRASVAGRAEAGGGAGGFASIEDSAEGRRLYVGTYADFDGLRFTNLREVEGWTPPRHGIDASLDPSVPGR